MRATRRVGAKPWNNIQCDSEQDMFNCEFNRNINEAEYCLRPITYRIPARGSRKIGLGVDTNSCTFL